MSCMRRKSWMRSPKLKLGKRVICHLLLHGGKTRQTAGYLAAPGLAVHKEGNRWYVSHILSGLSTVPGRGIDLKTKREAMRWARCLAEVIDFDVEKPEADYSNIKPIIKRFQAGHNPDA